jgi:hypothetical protein
MWCGIFCVFKNGLFLRSGRSFVVVCGFVWVHILKRSNGIFGGLTGRKWDDIWTD